eukprot:g26041.t1
MLRELLSRPRFCDLALIRSPDEFMPADPTVPRLRPGLYAGDYGHGMYGQYRVELRALAELNQSITFMRVVKQCGDLHVPMGATTFMAICAPENALDGAQNGPSRVQNRQTSSWESVARSWRGFGTLAMPGFGRPSWDTGWLVQFAHRAGEDRFGFVWDRAQDAVGLALMFAMMADALFIAKYSKEREAKAAERAFWHEDEPMEEVYRAICGFTQRTMIRFFPSLYVRYLKMTERSKDEDEASDTPSKEGRKKAVAAIEDKASQAVDPTPSK